MLSKTHLKIADKVVEKTIDLGYDFFWKQEEIEGVQCASSQTDKILSLKDVRVPHHYEREGSIKFWINDARKCYLKGKWDICAVDLGCAFHFICDRCVGMTGNDPRHNAYEREMDKCDILNDVTIRRINGRVNVFKYALMPLPTTSNAISDLNIAYDICLNICLAVLNPEPHPWKRIEDQLKGLTILILIALFVFAVWSSSIITMGLFWISVIVSTILYFGIRNIW